MVSDASRMLGLTHTNMSSLHDAPKLSFSTCVNFESLLGQR